MQCMYSCYKDEINIWCDGCPEVEDVESQSLNKKKHKSDDDTRQVSKRQTIRNEVEKIFVDLMA